MTNEGLDLLGRLARERREHLGLHQGDLAQYGGPRVSTVGKIERAEQGNYPTRTKRQLENALGWSRGTFDRILGAPASEWWDSGGLREDFIATLIEDDVPDLGNPVVRTAQVRRALDLTDDELLAELTYRMKAYAKEMHDVEAAASTRARGSRAVDVTHEVLDPRPVADPPSPARPARRSRRSAQG